MIRNATNDLSIKPKVSKNIQVVMALVGMLLFLFCLYQAYHHGVKSGHAQYDQDQSTINQLGSTMTALRQDLSMSEKSLIIAQRQQQIQEEAYKQISKAYANSEQKNSVLGSRVDFYRSIISPESGQSGPAIQELVAIHRDGRLEFDVTLVQAIKHKHQVRGNLRVTLYENEIVTGQWPAASSRSVSYQYFEQVSGVIERAILTESAKLKVELTLKDGSKFEKWQVVGNATASASKP